MSLPPEPAQHFQLEHDANGRLVLIDALGVRHVGAEPVRNFPISDPLRLITICDPEGRELASVEDLAQLEPVTRAVLERDLSRREFVPVISRIVNVASEIEPSEWEVETDRGPTRFLVNSADDVRRLDKKRALVIDAQGIRYMIDDTHALDRGSRRFLEHYL